MSLMEEDFITAHITKNFGGRIEFSFTDLIGNYYFNQDQEYPPEKKLNWDNPIVGVSEYGDYSRLQFISENDSRSKFDDKRTR